VEANWEDIKAQEKPERDHLLDGIPAGMPDLARAVKVASRLERAGHGTWLREQLAVQAASPARSLGAALMGLVLDSREQGVDPAAALRAVLRDLAGRLPPVD
jgi:XTP/dITP diphosphohydrolase